MMLTGLIGPYPLVAFFICFRSQVLGAAAEEQVFGGDKVQQQS